jgi:Lon protease-like protein
VGDILPLFPLGHVLLPGMPLPLHVFEPRYRQLLVDVRDENSLGSFGVVALRSGSEVEPTSRADVADVGTVAEIIEVQAYPDGASDLLTVGSRRFRVGALLPDEAPYLRAEIEWLEELDGDLQDGHELLARRLGLEFGRLLGDLTGRERDDDLPQDANLLSYHLAAQLPLSAEDRLALLAEATAADRLRAEIRLLRRELRLIHSTRSVAIAQSVLRLVAHPN